MARSQTITVRVPVSKRLYEEANVLVEEGFFQNISELTRISLAEKVLTLLGTIQQRVSYGQQLKSLRGTFNKSGLFEKKSVSAIVGDLRKSRESLWKEKYAQLYPDIR